MAINKNFLPTPICVNCIRFTEVKNRIKGTCEYWHEVREKTAPICIVVRFKLIEKT